MERVEKKDKEFDDLLDKWKELSYSAALISAAIEYSKSKESIAKKVENENVAITYGINSINKKVLENPQKYNNVENEFKELMERFEDNLVKLTNYHDSNIVQGYIKIVEEEKKQMEMYKQIYQLLKEELAKSELKVRRLKPTIKKKGEEKEKSVGVAMETEAQELQRDIKGPRAFSKATKFFFGKINPYKMIQKNVFSNVQSRIEKYEQEKNVKRINEKYLSDNLIKTINEAINNED